MEIKIVSSEEIARRIYYVTTVSVHDGKETHEIETVVEVGTDTNPEVPYIEVNEISWLTPPPQNRTKELDIKEAVKKHILENFE